MAQDELDPLELEHDAAFERRDWRAQRIGWTLLGIIAVLAVAGLFGGGPLSQQVATANGMEVRYERFVRRNAPSSIEVRIAPGLVPGGQRVRISIDQAYATALDIGSPRPEPVETAAVGNQVVYTFEADASGAPVTLVFPIQPDGFGRQRGRIGLVPNPAVTIEQFTYP